MTANCYKKKVQVRQLGSNPSAVGCEDLEKGNIATMQEGTLLHILTGKYPHKVRFFNPKMLYGETSKDSAKAKKSAVNDNNSHANKTVSKDNVKKQIEPPKKFINDYFGGGTSKRKSEDIDHGKAKKAKVDITEDQLSDDEEEEERVRQLQKQLQDMRQNFQKNDMAMKAKGATCKVEEDDADEAGPVEPRMGIPVKEAIWTEQGSLITYTSVGVEARHKVC